MARPTKLDGEALDDRVYVRVTTAEKVFVRQQASLAGLGESAYARRRILGLPMSPAPSRIDAAVISELNRIGVNLNQLARAKNSGQAIPGHWQELERELQRVLEKVAKSYGA